MKAKLLLAPAAGLALAMAGGCHDDHGSPPAPPPSTSQALDTAGVLALAEQTSETSSPFAVNGGAVTITGTSENTYPMAVNAM